MSALQAGLLLLGLAVLGAVLAYNAWALRRSQPRRSDPRWADAAAGAAGRDEATAALPAGTGDERIEPVLDSGPAAASVDAGALGVPAAERRALLDPLIDSIVALSLEQPVSGDAVLAALPGSRRIGTKPLAVEGLHVDSGLWELPRPGQRYSALQAGVQLANRTGALNQIEFSEFVVVTQGLADALGALPDFPDMGPEVARARELDQFASAHDALLSLTIRAARTAWSPGFVAQHAARLGLVAGALPGRMVLPAAEAGASPLLVLQYETRAALADDPEQAALRQIDLLLDVAHVDRAERPFVRLRECAAALAQSMEGEVTDDAGQPLGKDALDRIGADLETLYEALEQRDLAAGSSQARRLFS